MSRVVALTALASAAVASPLFVTPSSTGNLRGVPSHASDVATAATATRASAAGASTTATTVFAAAASVAVVSALQAARRRTKGVARRGAAVVRHAYTTTGSIDQATGEKNYVNPWEEHVEDDLTIEKTAKPTASGAKFLPYDGPVYNKVPIVEGIQFPLDPTLYQEPLVPPEPGKKWGDGREPDGNWYMEVDGNKVQYWQGVGRRKTACAIVRIVKGTGQFIVNGRDAIDYFQLYPIHWLKACEPMTALSVKNDYDCLCKAFGGGLSGQAGAIRLGLARAMQELNFNWRPLLKKGKYLTRDWRTVERKKTGRPKARKSTPFHKR